MRMSGERIKSFVENVAEKREYDERLSVFLLATVSQSLFSLEGGKDGGKEKERKLALNSW